MSDKEMLLALASMLKPIEDKINKIDTEMQHINSKVDDIGTRVKKIEINLENDVVPRIRQIESCYLSTYERYAKEVDNIDDMKTKIALIEQVVEKHSGILQKTS